MIKRLVFKLETFSIFPREEMQSESLLNSAGMNSSPAGCLIVSQHFLISFSTSALINSYYRKQSHVCKALALQIISV